MLPTSLNVFFKRFSPTSISFFDDVTCLNFFSYQFILEISVDTKDATGTTPLMNAAPNGYVQAVKGLIKRGADPSLINNEGWSSLHFAAHCGDPNIIDLILPHVSDIGSKNADGATPLIIAVRHRNLQIVKQLLEWGANPLTKDNNGHDSLYLASSRDSDVLDLLLSHVPDGE